MMVTSPPRNQQAVAFPLRAESEAAGSKSLCHRADEARKLVCHRLCYGVSAGVFSRTRCAHCVISPGERLAAVQPCHVFLCL